MRATLGAILGPAARQGGPKIALLGTVSDKSDEKCDPKPRSKNIRNFDRTLMPKVTPRKGKIIKKKCFYSVV